jgi:uncharacterized protein (DUF2164 family)
MEEIKRKGDILTKEKKRQVINEIINFFKSEREEDIGIIAAEKVLDFFLENVGLELYNKGIEDSKNFLKERIDDLELDMESLLKK